MKPLQVDLQPSFRLAAMLVTASAGAALTLLLVTLPWWLKLAGLVVIVLACYWQLRLHAMRSAPAAWVGMAWTAEGGWQAWRRDGAGFGMVILPDSFVSSALMVIRFRTEGERWPQALVLLADSADSESLRRLRVRLRWAYIQTSERESASTAR